MKCTTNEELWEYQSTFLNRRSIRVSDEYSEKWFYNKSAVYNYMLKCIFRYKEGCNLGEEKDYAIRLLQGMKKPDDSFDYYDHNITFTDQPFPRILSRSDNDNRFVLIKRLDDIPILCKGPIGYRGNIWGDLGQCLDASIFDFGLVQTHNAYADWLPDVPNMFDTDREYTLGVWGNCNKTDALHGSLHFRDGIDEIVSGDLLVTGVEAFSRSPYEFDLRAYLQNKEKAEDDPRYFFDDYFGILNRKEDHPAFGKDTGLSEKEIQKLFPDDMGGSYRTEGQSVEWDQYWIE